MSVIAEYFGYQDSFEKKYGPKTVVLMQIGSFYEVYCWDPARLGEAGRKVGVAPEISLLLNMILTSKDSNEPHSQRNPLLVGFPTASFERHKETILQNGYTIVHVIQIGSGKNVKRSIKEILSPATNLDTFNPTMVKNIVSLYIDVQTPNRKYESTALTCGVACLDVTTGRNLIVENHSREEDPIIALQDIYRFLVAHAPQEVILNVVTKSPDPHYTEFITSTLQLNRYPLVLTYTNQVPADYHKIPYQQQFLGKIFGTGSAQENFGVGAPNVFHRDLTVAQEDIITTLHLERYDYGRLSYLLLLQYVYDHNELLIQKLQRPETNWIDAGTHLILAHNALVQLDVTTTDCSAKPKGLDCLLTLVDNTRTGLGHRYLRTLLLNPSNQPQVLEYFYQLTDELLSKPDLQAKLEKNLKLLPDLERLHRKLTLQVIKPTELALLFTGYTHLVTIITDIMTSDSNLLRTLLPVEADMTLFNQLLQSVLSQVDMQILKTCRMTDSEFEAEKSYLYPGKNPEVDQLQANVQAYRQRIDTITNHLDEFLPKVAGKKARMKLQQTEEGIFQLTTTPHRVTLLRNSPINTTLCGHLHYHELKKNEMLVTSEVIAASTQGLQKCHAELIAYLRHHYTTLITYLAYFTFYPSLNRCVALLDYIQSNARTSQKYKFFRPKIIPGENSYCHIEAMRHPLVERLIHTPYIPNTLTLGGPNGENKSPYGLLLYGINAAGKSVLTKAVGLNIILAQAGMFTPGKLTYTPYNKIITRLSGQDDIFRGASTFQIEMEELRTILRQADNRTLVLGDELCHGTETISATSLCIATYLTLLERKSSFVFSTHLHHVATDPHITSLEPGKLRIAHLATTYDEATETIIYNRELQDGPGSSIYGLHVARALHLDIDFLQRAQTIRHTLTETGPQFLPLDKSRYNKDVYLDACKLCGKKNTLQTHHIREQNEADAQRMIDHWHQNRDFNLVVLCQDCHIKLHQQGKQIVLQPTLNGNRLQVA